MKSLIFIPLLSLGLLSISFAGSIELDTELKDSKKRFLSTSNSSFGVLPVKIEKDLMKSFGSIALADVANYHSVSPLREVNVTQVRYTYLKASSFDAVTGETSIYSEVIEVYQPIVVGEESQVLVEREELLSEFQENLQEKFPNQTFSYGVSNLQGLFNSWDDANKAKKESIQKAQQYSSISSIAMAR